MENDGCIHGLLSDFEYAKAMSNESASPDPKTVRFDIKDRIFLMFDQGTLYFMPMEIHRGRKYTPANTRPLSNDEFAKFSSGLSQLPRKPEAILRYAPNHNQESLMWVALWIVYGLVHSEEAEKIQLQIFTNIRLLTSGREYFFTEADPWKGDLRKAFHPNLGDIYPKYFHMMRLELYASCLLVEPKEEDYHRLFNHLSVAFDQLLATVAGNPGIVPLVQSDSENQLDVEVERPRETGHTMTLRSHVQDSAVCHSRL